MPAHDDKVTHDGFGASAPHKDVYNYFNITPEAVAQAAMRCCNG
ncbi:MAG TPA: hypothetical protein VGP28_02625 [Methylocella sp.]|jgi:transketolase|nr:hypothetical protein [Methylocella sp.]